MPLIAVYIFVTPQQVEIGDGFVGIKRKGKEKQEEKKKLSFDPPQMRVQEHTRALYAADREDHRESWAYSDAHDLASARRVGSSKLTK